MGLVAAFASSYNVKFVILISCVVSSIFIAAMKL